MLTKALGSDKAAATASALTLPFALAASCGYLLLPTLDGCGPACAGGIYLPALAAAGMTAVLIAPLAAKLRPFLARPAERLFAVIVITTVCGFGLPSQTIVSLLTETGNS